jgi:hypothetical protein
MKRPRRKRKSKREYAFDIYIVGLGIVGIRHLTKEAEDALRSSREIFYLDPGFGIAEHLKGLCSCVTDLFPVSYREGEPRINAYDRMAIPVLDAAMDHPPVSFAVYGHPTVYVYPSSQIRLAANLLGLKAKIFPAISALDCLFIDLHFDPGLQGLQMYEATDIILRDRPLQPDVPCLLWQAGTVESALYSKSVNTPERFLRLQRHLLKFYPPEHLAIAVYTSTFPLAPSLAKAFPVGELAERFAVLPQGATIFIPPVFPRPIANKELLDHLESQQHLDSVTVART